MVHLHVDYYSAVRKSEIMKFAGKCTKLETTVLGEVTRTQKDRYRLFSLRVDVRRKLYIRELQPE